MSNEMMKREMQEAVQAGERALQSLYAARDKLGSARNWGIFDMLGGGFISDFVKHSKMNDAAALMEQAKSDIQRFQRELRCAGFLGSAHGNRQLPFLCGFLSGRAGGRLYGAEQDCRCKRTGG